MSAFETLDFIDRYWFWSMNGFYEKLKDDLTGYGQRLAEALEKEDERDIKIYLGMIKAVRQTLTEMSDENLEVGDFARLVTSKYQVIPDD